LVVNLIGVCPAVMFSYSYCRSVSLAFQLDTRLLRSRRVLKPTHALTHAHSHARTHALTHTHTPQLYEMKIDPELSRGFEPG